MPSRSSPSPASNRYRVEQLQFEARIDEFVKLVLARLEAVGASDANLRGLWQEVLEERADPNVANLRKLEAQLGFEPTEAPEELLTRFDELSLRTGKAAASELASACAGADPAVALNKVVEFAESQGADGRIVVPESVRQALNDPAYKRAAPWERGRILARDARLVWNLGSGPVSDLTLADLLNVSAATMSHGRVALPRLPLGLAIRHEGTESVSFLFRKRNRPGVRFEATRFLADHVVTPGEERWLPAADTKTARQKVQRAFAAEFLCPIDTLVAFLEGDFSTEAIEEAGEHFGVSALAVRSHLANNDLIPFEAVTV